MRKLMIVTVCLLPVVLAGCYSCQTWNSMWGKGKVVEGSEHKFFWDKDCKLAAQPAPKPEPKPAPAPKPVVKGPCAVPTAVGHYPCEGCVVARLERQMPEQVMMNNTFDYTIAVVNPTQMMLSDVVVTEMLPENFKAGQTTPTGKADGRKMHFELGTLEPGQKKVITVSGMATSAECLKTCATVSYVIPTCTSVQVVQPALKLTKTAPARVLLCEQIPVKFVVTNTGTGSATDVKIEDTLPAGLRTADGRSSIMINAGTLASGESKEYSVMLKADKTGTYDNKATAMSASGLKAEAMTTTEVRQPVLTVAKKGPEKEYIGRPLKYEITIMNKGDADATETVLMDSIPAGAGGVAASDGGTVSGSSVTWRIGTLKAGGSKTVSVTYSIATAGTVSNTAKAMAVCAEDVSASVKTAISGIAAVLLEVIDVDDPILVGNTETYVITATNQGSTADTNIQIICTLEDSQEYVSSSGATQGSLSGRTVTFAPLASLAPKAKATWRVTVKAVKPGDIRFTTVMNTDQLTRPVQETESTNQYQ